MALFDDELLRTIKKVGEFIHKGNIKNDNLTLLLSAAEYGHLDIVK